MTKISNELVILNKEEQNWRQKTSLKWVKEGDANTKLYHRVVNGRRRRNEIKELELEGGVVECDMESVG